MQHFPDGTTAFQQIIHQSKYARFLHDKGRREFWPETVDRVVNFYKQHVTDELHVEIPDSKWEEIRKAIWNMDVFPSMRAMMTAGPALAKDNVAAFNCSYIPIRDTRSYAEMMYILMCGTGVGYTVERQDVKNLPEVPAELTKRGDICIEVQDSKIGWADSLMKLLDHLYMGYIPLWDTMKLRPKGAILKTFGGRASGPGPLEDLFRFIVESFKNAQGRRLTSLECHDIACKVADAVVSGGVRRSALICLSNLSDNRMRDAKVGEFWLNNPQRSNANNSAAYTEKPEVSHFMQEWLSIFQSGTGERGIFNREGAKKKVRSLPGRDANHEFGTNPCGEIILRPYEFCNLCEIVVRPWDTLESLSKKVEIATILGTIQSTFTNFRFIRPEWKKNCDEERLLGIGLTGIFDHAVLSTVCDDAKVWLTQLRNKARHVNGKYARKFNINSSVAITCIKPSGTASKLAKCPSGIHPQRGQYVTIRIRSDNKDPMTQFLKDQGVYWEPEVGKEETMTVFSFPEAAAPGAATEETLKARDHFQLIQMYNLYWADHNTSCTIKLADHEWPGVGADVWDNWDNITGMAFLPRSGGSYIQAPQEIVDKQTHDELLSITPTSINWNNLELYEKGEDHVKSAKDLACVAGACVLAEI